MKPVVDSLSRLRLRAAFKLVLGVAVIAVLMVLVAYMGGGADRQPERLARIPVDDLAPGQARRHDWNGRPVMVLHRDSPVGGWFVVIASGTAMGCPVVWEPAQGYFLEACSGTRYDAAGKPLDAPEISPLRVPPHHFDSAGRLVLGRD